MGYSHPSSHYSAVQPRHLTLWCHSRRCRAAPALRRVGVDDRSTRGQPCPSLRTPRGTLTAGRPPTTGPISELSTISMGSIPRLVPLRDLIDDRGDRFVI